MTDVDAQKIEIVIVEKQTIDVRADAIERLARLLAKADGLNPDGDWRLRGNTMLTIHAEYPASLEWYRYREKAEALLKRAFAP